MIETKESFQEFQERVRKQYGPMYFDRQGIEMELMDWGRKCEDEDYKILKQEEIDRYFVSTVWIGLNMQMFKQLPIQIFETMVFLKDEDNKNPDDPLNMYQKRYSTEEEALRGHEETLAIIRAQLIIEERTRCQAEENVTGSQSADPVLLP